MNSVLIKRFYDTLKYYNPTEQIYPHFRGYYDFLILQTYLNSKNKIVICSLFNRRLGLRGKTILFWIKQVLDSRIMVVIY